MSWLAYEIGDVSSAEGWAEEALRIPDVVRRIPYMTPGSFFEVHELQTANVVLGKIALQRGDIADAERFLACAADARSTGHPRLLLEDPDFTLARELLERGRSEPVVAYLTSCRATWVYGEQHVDRWIRAVEIGAIPDLDPWRAVKPSWRLTARAMITAVHSAWVGHRGSRS